MTEPKLSYIGQGGGGSDDTVPECPVCGAYGGGGHGGNCWFGPSLSRCPLHGDAIGQGRTCIACDGGVFL